MLATFTLRCCRAGAAACRPAAAAAVTRCIATTLPRGKLFDRLIPEDDAELKRKKQLEADAIKRRLQRSKLAEMAAAKREKVSRGWWGKGEGGGAEHSPPRVWCAAV
jgi:hypothetical protein